MLYFLTNYPTIKNKMATLNTKTHQWYIVYNELADLLAEFYEKEKENAGSSLFRLCYDDNVSDSFRENNTWINKFPEFLIESIDSFHVFASFNGNTLKKENRIKRINIYFRILNKYLDKKNNQDYDLVKGINFAGCPTPFTINMLSRRSSGFQKNIWKWFAAVHNRKQSALERQPNSTKDLFTDIKNWYGVGIKSFATFLFWTNYNHFLPLDGNTVQYLLDRGRIDEEPNTIESYLGLLTVPYTDTYRLIAAIALNPEELEDSVLNDDNKRKLVADYLRGNKLEDKKDKDKSNQTDLEIIKEAPQNDQFGFQVIAIKLEKGCSEQYLKNLNIDKPYYF